ncbi:MAG: peptidoglycan DD-metalloendopeptidase family protein [Pseudomonadota bacterium]
MRWTSLPPLLALLSWVAVFPAAAQEAGDPALREQSQLASRLEQLREETAATKARARELGDTLVNLAGDEAKLRQELEAVSARVRDIENSIAADENALADITTDQAAIRQELAARREELAVVLMALQRIGKRPPPALFVGEGAPRRVVQGAILLNGAVPGLDAQAQDLARKISEAARLGEAERQRWGSLRDDLARVEEERDRLLALVGELERRRALSLYERDQVGADLARLAQEANSVEALLARFSDGSSVAVTAPQDPENLGFAARRGDLADAVAGTVVGNYGDATPTGAPSEGRTVAALPRSTVFAPMPGTVLYAAPFRSFGEVLILDAGDGYHMVLTGLAESFVKMGDTVDAGSPLGRMGAEAGRSAIGAVRPDAGTLTATRPLLYVELRKDGTAIDTHGWWRDADTDVGRTGG